MAVKRTGGKTSINLRTSEESIEIKNEKLRKENLNIGSDYEDETNQKIGLNVEKQNNSRVSQLRIM